MRVGGLGAGNPLPRQEAGASRDPGAGGESGGAQGAQTGDATSSVGESPVAEAVSGHAAEAGTVGAGFSVAPCRSSALSARPKGLAGLRSGRGHGKSRK